MRRVTSHTTRSTTSAQTKLYTPCKFTSKYAHLGDMCEAKILTAIWYERPGISGSGICQRKSQRNGLSSILPGKVSFNFLCFPKWRKHVCLLTFPISNGNSCKSRWYSSTNVYNFKPVLPGDFRVQNLVQLNGWHAVEMWKCWPAKRFRAINMASLLRWS